MKKFLFYLSLLWTGVLTNGACTDKEQHSEAFPDATFVLESERQDLLQLTGFGTREIYLYYGKGVADTYLTAINWDTSDAGVVTVRNHSRVTRGDSCFSIASVTPTEVEGSATIKATLTKDGQQRTLYLPVTTNGMEGIDVSQLPEGAFADTLGKSAFAMIFIKADTIINVGERLGIDRENSLPDPSTWINKDSMMQRWRYLHYDLYKWNEDSVYVADFYAGQKEVTVGLWKEVMGHVPGYGYEYNYPGWYRSKLFFDRYNFNLPVWNASYLECVEFIQKLRERTGIPYRLLTHAEYQFVCDGGRTGVCKVESPNILGLYNLAQTSTMLQQHNMNSFYDPPEWAEGKCYYRHSVAIPTDSFYIDDEGRLRRYNIPYDTIVEARPHFRHTPDGCHLRTNMMPIDLDMNMPSFAKENLLAGLRLGLSAADWKKLKGLK